MAVVNLHVNKTRKLFLFLSFRSVLNVICCFLGNSPGVWILIADVSELNVSSIFIGRWMKYVSGWIVWGIYTELSWSGEVAEPIGSGVPVRAHHFLLALPLPRSNPTRYKYRTHSIHWHNSFTCLWRWNRQWVPKRRQLELRRPGITQKGTNYMTFVTNKFKSGGLHEKHVVATWNVGNRLSVCF